MERDSANVCMNALLWVLIIKKQATCHQAFTDKEKFDASHFG